MKKNIVIIVIILLIIATYVLLIMPLAGERANLRDTIQAKYLTLKKYESFLKTAGKTEGGADAVIKEVEAMEADIIHETNESLAFVKIQGYIQEFAEKSGVRITSIKPLAVVKYKQYSSLPVQLEASGGIVQLGEFLKQVDASKKLVKMDKLNITVINVQMPAELKAKIQVSGLMKL